MKSRVSQNVHNSEKLIGGIGQMHFKTIIKSPTQREYSSSVTSVDEMKTKKHNLCFQLPSDFSGLTEEV